MDEEGGKLASYCVLHDCSMHHETRTLNLLNFQLKGEEIW